jgi:hypothetical protein
MSGFKIYYINGKLWVQGFFSFYNRGRYKAPSQFKIALFFSQSGGKKFTISKEISQNIGTLSLKYIVYLPVKHDLRQFQEHRNSFNQDKWF